MSPTQHVFSSSFRLDLRPHDDAHHTNKYPLRSYFSIDKICIFLRVGKFGKYTDIYILCWIDSEYSVNMFDRVLQAYIYHVSIPFQIFEEWPVMGK